MKKVTRVLFVMTIGLIGFSSYAQFGAKAGLGASSLIIKDNDNNITQDFGNAGFSFLVGAGFEIDFSDQFSLEPGLLLTQKTSTFDLADLVTFKFLYIESPINFKYYFVDLGDSTRFYGLGGGYLGFMISGKVDNTKLDIGNNANDDIKSLDYGLNFGAGAQFFDALNVDISAGIGIANLSNDVGNGLRNKNNVVRLTVTYQFGG